MIKLVRPTMLKTVTKRMDVLLFYAYVLLSLLSSTATQTSEIETPSCGDVVRRCDQRRWCRQRIEFEISSLVNYGSCGFEEEVGDCSFWCNNAFYYFAVHPHPSRKINAELLTCDCERDHSELFSSLKECQNFQAHLEPCRLNYLMDDNAET
ncbi:uncharacterized protein [Ptychodera flava]|uniref:uncharacterized protein n=1 Tax=Ptychodera flava TaxID=63121 RepID=UPI003969C5CF